MKTLFLTIIQIGFLFIFYYIGTWIQEWLQLAIPGSIIGMLLLFLLLLTKVVPEKWVNTGSSFLLSHLPLLFVPVTVGIMDYFSLFKGRGMLSLVVVIVGTLLVFIVAGYTSQWVAKRQEKKAKLDTNVGAGKGEQA